MVNSSFLPTIINVFEDWHALTTDASETFVTNRLYHFLCLIQELLKVISSLNASIPPVHILYSATISNCRVISTILKCGSNKSYLFLSKWHNRVVFSLSQEPLEPILLNSFFPQLAHCSCTTKLLPRSNIYLLLITFPCI